MLVGIQGHRNKKKSEGKEYTQCDMNVGENDIMVKQE